MPDIYKSARITWALIVLNIIMFAAEVLLGGSLDPHAVISLGAFYTPLVAIEGQYLRLLAACFIHFGAEHLMSNMLALFAAGSYVERNLGKVKYLFLYLISGICGNILTLAAELYNGEYHVSAGASGAISGVLGFFLLETFFAKGKRNVPAVNIILAFICMVGGSANGNTNIMAHAGGFLAGCLMYAFFRHGETA